MGKMKNAIWNLDKGVLYPPIAHMAKHLPWAVSPAANSLAYVGAIPGLSIPDILFKSQNAL